MIEKYKNYLLLHLIVFIYGFTGILGRLISIQAIDLVWFRMLIAVAVLFAYVKIAGKSIRVSPKNIVRYSLIGLLIAAHWVTFYHAIKVSNISITVVCLASCTFFTSLIEPLFYKRPVIFYEVIFGILIVIGLYFIFNFQRQYSLGIFYGIISAFLASIFPVLNGKLAKTHNAYAVSVFELFGGFAGLTIFLLFTSSFSAGFFDVSVLDLLYISLLAIVCTAFTFVISIHVMKEISPYTVVLSINLEPVYTIIFAYFIFREKEQMTTDFYVGTCFVLLTIFANAYLKTRTRRQGITVVDRE
jgi:drug/metabolite transporter (DMT)-like permease